MELRMLYVTFPDEETATNISEVLLSEKLIACYNLYPMNSGYWWEGQISRDNEITSIMKTTIQKVEKINHKICSLHPYDVPCIINLSFSANEAYAQWVINSVNS